jgi:hypothetical protein
MLIERLDLRERDKKRAVYDGIRRAQKHGLHSIRE